MRQNHRQQHTDSLNAPLVQQARQFLQQEDVPAAVQCLHTLLETDPAGLGTIWIQGLLAMAVGEYAAALEAMVHLARHLPRTAPVYVESSCHRSRLLQALGRLDEARAAALDATMADPGCGEGWNELARIALRQQAWSLALEAAQKAQPLIPGNADMWNHLGMAQKHAGDDMAAEQSFRQALALNPRLGAALSNLGGILLARGDHEGAEPVLRQALEVSPANMENGCNLVLTLRSLKRRGEAMELAGELLARVAADSPARLKLLNASAGILFDAGRSDEALALLEQAEASLTGADGQASLLSAEEQADIWSNLGALCLDFEETARAKGYLDRALHCVPQHIGAMLALGEYYFLLNDHLQSFLQMEEVLRISPGHCQALTNQATLLRNAHLYGKCSEKCAEVLASTGAGHKATDVFLIYSTALVESRQAREGNQMFVSVARRLQARNIWMLSCFIYSLICDEQAGEDEYRQMVDAWRRKAASGRPDLERPHRNERTPGRRLRIGYVSPDFRRHSVSYFFEPVLLGHDRSAVEVFLYASSNERDDVTRRLEQEADGFANITGMGNTAAAQRIVDDGIDVLVDLAGHTSHNRLPLFALKPAPVQCTWLGYPGTTGLAEIDARLVDGLTDPVDSQEWASEQLLRLPRCFLAYQAGEGMPEPAPLPSLSSGGAPEASFTFGSFNNGYKITPQVVRVWSQILHRVPGSRMVIKARQMKDETVTAALLQEFAGCGIEASRLILMPWEGSYAGHLALYGQIDLALDTFPYNGTTTTCEAMWMGVPTVCLRGDRHISRVGVSLMTTVGLQDEFLADDEAGYVALAASWAGRRPALAAIRQGLRQRMQASPLCDAPGLARALEGAYRQLWQDWCALPEPTFLRQQPGLEEIGQEDF